MFNDILLTGTRDEDALTDKQVSIKVFAGHLLPGENIVWWGRPQQGFLLTRRDWVAVPFSLFWGGFAFFWEAQVLQSEHPFPFALFGLPFVLAGIYFMVGRFIFDAWLRLSIFYALTDRRVLIVRGAPWPSFKAMSLNRLPDVTLYENASGRGTIRFGTPALVSDGEGGTRYASSMTAALDPTPHFLAIDDARTVFTAIQQRAQSM